MGDREGTMARNLSKCVFVLLVLALSGLIFLLRNIHSVEVRMGSTAAPCQVFPTMGSPALREHCCFLLPHVEQ